MSRIDHIPSNSLLSRHEGILSPGGRHIVALLNGLIRNARNDAQ
jgi:hypothetical protein